MTSEAVPWPPAPHPPAWPPGWVWTGDRWVPAGPEPRKRWAKEVPGGERFHRLGRTSAHRWWRPLLGTVALVVGIVLVLAPVGVAAVAIAYAAEGSAGVPDDRLFSNPLAELGFTLGALALMSPVVVLTVWLVGRRRPGSVISVVGRMRWRWLAICCGLSLGTTAVSLPLMSIVGLLFESDSAGEDPSFVGWGELLPAALVILLLVPFQSAAEELVFRGWLLQAIGGSSMQRLDGSFRGPLTRRLGRVLATPWLAMLVTSVLFIAMHGYTGWATAELFCFAMVTAFLTVRTGGLEAAIAMHVFNNLLAFLVGAAFGMLDDSLEQGGAPAHVLLSGLPPMLLYAGLVLWVAQQVDLPTRSPVPVSEPPAPAAWGLPAAVG